MAEQDDLLDLLGSSASRQKELAMAISTEVDSQNRLLEDIDLQAEGASNKLDSATRRAGELLKRQKSTKTICLLCCLIVLLVVLLSIVLHGR
mmetsp:Transcript_47795/g.112393  ORF Transcript_47795/g.112393 Transcript_47795/m.112393 type:complete len:92 (-) Transcript_47795:42-317(-)